MPYQDLVLGHRFGVFFFIGGVVAADVVALVCLAIGAATYLLTGLGTKL